jgi:hypothetical protein
VITAPQYRFSLLFHAVMNWAVCVFCFNFCVCPSYSRVLGSVCRAEHIFCPVSHRAMYKAVSLLLYLFCPVPMQTCTGQCPCCCICFVLSFMQPRSEQYSVLLCLFFPVLQTRTKQYSVLMCLFFPVLRAPMYWAVSVLL